MQHYYLCCLSRECSILGRKQVLTGKAKFGIIGDGKELPQVALSTQFERGDWRSGYYRDQTLMMALDLCTPSQFFAQLYADAKNDPFSGGRQMNSHFATPTIDENGNLLPLKDLFNISSDISCTAGQMARGLGLAFASKKFRRLPQFAESTLSDQGNEICWVTIGDASTSEGVFWESLNAAGVLQVPMVINVWDDGYGISVPTEFQTTKGSISEALHGLQRTDTQDGIEIIRVKAWDYPGLIAAYEKAASIARKDHVPVLVHVQDVTQQLGHSTSGSHERYKSKERLAFEAEFDCNKHFRAWLLVEGYASEEQLVETEERATNDALSGMRDAWGKSLEYPKNIREELLKLLPADSAASKALTKNLQATRYESVKQARRHQLTLTANGHAPSAEVQNFIDKLIEEGYEDYSSNLYLKGKGSISEVEGVPAVYAEKPKKQPGYQLLNRFFDSLLERDARVLAFGEDVGQIGDVNQGFAGLQNKYGEERVFDTGIREWTIVGQAIGLALRGFRPIAEIQYLDYLIYAISALSDDLASTLYRTDGMQRAPVIIRSRGHRLEGIWHAGSPLGMIVNALRGVHVCVPRNMLQAVGMYNTLMKASEPGLVIETLNAYRLREDVPTNVEAFTLPLGVPEFMTTGEDITVVTYGACVPICQEAAELLRGHGISVELIDVQTLLPFDIHERIGASVRKTNRVLVVDEDVPGGASAYILRNLLDEQHIFTHLDVAPETLTAKAHRPPFGSDGDYFTKPNVEEIAEAVIKMMRK